MVIGTDCRELHDGLSRGDVFESSMRIIQFERGSVVTKVKFSLIERTRDLLVEGVQLNPVLSRHPPPSED